MSQTSQRNVNEAMGVAYQRLLSTVSVNHPKTEDRITDTAEYFERHYGSRALVEPTSASWKALRARPEVALVLRNYKQAFLAKKLLDQGKNQDAYATARTAITGRTPPKRPAVVPRARPRARRSQRARGAPARGQLVEPVPTSTDRWGPRGAENLPAPLEGRQESKTFGGAPRWMPHKIRPPQDGTGG